MTKSSSTEVKGRKCIYVGDHECIHTSPREFDPEEELERFTQGHREFKKFLWLLLTMIIVLTIASIGVHFL